MNYNGFYDICEFIDLWVVIVFFVSYEMIVIDNGFIVNEVVLL